MGRAKWLGPTSMSACPHSPRHSQWQTWPPRNRRPWRTLSAAHIEETWIRIHCVLCAVCVCVRHFGTDFDCRATDATWMDQRSRVDVAGCACSEETERQRAHTEGHKVWAVMEVRSLGPNRKCVAYLEFVLCEADAIRMQKSQHGCARLSTEYIFVQDYVHYGISVVVLEYVISRSGVLLTFALVPLPY